MAPEDEGRKRNLQLCSLGLHQVHDDVRGHLNVPNNTLNFHTFLNTWYFGKVCVCGGVVSVMRGE